MSRLLKVITNAVKAGQTIEFSEKTFCKRSVLEVRVMSRTAEARKEHTWVFEMDHLKQCYGPEEIVSAQIEALSNGL